MAIKEWVCQRHMNHKTFILLLIFALTACTQYSNIVLWNDDSGTANEGWQKNGMLAISRNAPAVTRAHARTGLGFIPAALHGTPTGSWLSIDREQSLIKLMKGDQVVYKLKGDGFTELRGGLFKVKHKQRSPLWYAPDAYFQERNLQPPAEGDKSRFRRGALGDFVIFIDQDTPIHAGPLWMPEIGGIKMDEADLSKIYYSLEVGSEIEVK